MRLAGEQQASSEFWAVGPASLVGPQAVSTGVKRFLLTVSIKDRLTSDLALDFDEVPSAETIQTWQTTLGAATLEGNAVCARISMEADEVQQKFAQIADSPLGERLAALVEAAQYLPTHNTTVPAAAAPKSAKPVIYGLDGGPRELGQDSTR
jgi:hypothetical protein